MTDQNSDKNSTKPTVLITGAYTAGVGSSIREVFHDAGWFVITTYDSSDKLQIAVSKKDLNSRKIDVSLTDYNSIASMVEQLPLRINAFIHAAMFFEMDSTFNQNVWSNTLQVNVISAAQIVESLRGRLSGGGSVVAISSTEAFTGSFGSPAYSASRAAMHNLVQSWANKFGSEGIRANAIAAGWIGGVMDTDEVFNKSRKITPLGRLGLPEEVANTAKFLCSSEASFINGSVVTVDGGYSGVDSVSKYEYQEHLAATDFHRFTSEFMVGRAGVNDEIWAVSTMFAGEWDEGDFTARFIEDQLSAAKRGAQINRVFVVSKEALNKLNNSHPLTQLHHGHPNIHGYVVDRDDLKNTNPELLKHLGNGWTAFNDEVLILDSAGTTERGVLVTHNMKLATLRKYFDQLLKFALPL